MPPEEIDNVSTNQDLVVSGTSTTPIEETPAATPPEATPPEITDPPKERTTKDALDEVIAKVKARKGEKKDDDTPPATKKDDKTPTGKTGEAPAATPTEYKPDFKFKFMGTDGKQVEKELPKEIQSLIKDEATEKLVKSVYSKAEGIEGIQAQREAIRTERDQARQEATGLKDGINSLRADYQRGDLDSFFGKLKIPIERVMQYALEKAQYMELPADQRAKIDAQRQAERQAFEAQNQNQFLTQNLQQQMSQARVQMLELTLMKPDVATVASSFDTQYGKPGLFKQTVINHGKITWNDSGGKVDLSPEQAVQQVMEIYGLKAGVALPAGTPATPAAVETPATTAPNAVIQPKKPTTTIPNVRGSGSASPLPPKAKSTEDLKKIYKEKFG